MTGVESVDEPNTLGPKPFVVDQQKLSAVDVIKRDMLRALFRQDHERVKKLIYSVDQEIQHHVMRTGYTAEMEERVLTRIEAHLNSPERLKLEALNG